jgi:hypothetical protein
MGGDCAGPPMRGKPSEPAGRCPIGFIIGFMGQSSKR